jgi:hypothetical protein
LGFSQTLKNSNLNTPVIPEGLGQSWEHGNHSKELVASSQSSVPNTKSKIHCTRHKTRGLNQIKSPEGTRRIGPPFPIKSLTRFQQSMDKNNSNERNRGRRTQGRRPGETESPQTDYKSRRPISRKSPEPSSVLAKVWNSYGKAKPTQKTSNERAKPQSKSEANWENCRTDLPGPVRPVGLRHPLYNDLIRRPRFFLRNEVFSAMPPS